MFETLQVKRRFEPVGTASPWERHPFEATVWECDEAGLHVRAVVVPPDYVPGLLRCYIREHHVDLAHFVTALQRIGLTLRDVERAIAAPPSLDAVDPSAPDPGTLPPRA